VEERSGDGLGEESPAPLSTWRLSDASRCSKVYERERKLSSFNGMNTLLEHVVVRYSMPSSFAVFLQHQNSASPSEQS